MKGSLGNIHNSSNTIESESTLVFVLCDLSMKCCFCFVLGMLVILLWFVYHVIAMRHTDHAPIKNVLLKYLIQ